MDALHVLLLILAAAAAWWSDRRGRRRLQAARREHERRLAFSETVLDTISDGVAVCDAQGRLMLLNRAAKEWHGLPALDVHVDDLPARYDLFRSDGVTPLPPEESPLGRAFAGETLRDAELMVCPPGRPRRRLLASGGPIFGPGLARLGAVVTLRDMTGQRQAEREARQAQAIIEGSASILIKWRVAERWPVEYVSENINQFGYEAAEFTEGRRDFPSIVHPDDLPQAEREVLEHIEAGQDGFFQQYRVIGASGEVHWVNDWTNVIRDDHGHATHIHGIITDMTRQREAELRRAELEEQMRRTQKLESLGVLAGGVAHDFNNILMAVLGNAELARMELPPDAPALEYIGEIEQASEQAADLCNQMLAYSGKGRIRLRDVDLSSTVREIMQMIGVSVSKKITLIYDLADDLPAFHADVSQIRQVIMNLITNAGEAIGDRTGEIRIRTGRQAECSCCDDASCLFLEVEDTGCGMDDETRDRLFEPFFTTKFTGRGLGMAAVGGIVKAHGGRIEIDSEPGRGTRIRVILPGKPPQGEDDAEAATRPASASREAALVLLVDDEETVRRMGARQLERLGHRVVTAADGLEALTAVKAEPGIQAVLMDLTMPRVDGAEALVEMRRLRPDLPVILSSGYHAESLSDRLPEDTPFIQKPYRREELAAVLAAALAPAPA